VQLAPAVGKLENQFSITLAGSLAVPRLVVLRGLQFN
jgi:hypothetical protein